MLRRGSHHPIRVLRRDECVRVRRLWTASALVHLPIGLLPRPRPTEESGAVPWRLRLDESGFRHLLDRAVSVLGPSDTTDVPPRIYLTRKASQRRRLLNATRSSRSSRTIATSPMTSKT